MEKGVKDLEKLELLFYKEPKQWNGTKQRGWITIKVDSKNAEFTSRELSLVMEKLNRVLIRSKSENIKGVNLIFNNINFRDKAVYILFEVLIYYFLKNVSIFVKVINKAKDSYPGFRESLIYKNITNDLLNREKYLHMFEKKFEISSNKFRNLVGKDVKEEYFSTLMGNIYSFLSNIMLSIENEIIEEMEDYINDLSEVIIELVENAIEHSESGCLLDINVYLKENKEISIDVVILNISDFLLADKLRKRLNLRKDKNINQRILKALEVHKNSFDTKYTEEDFFNISVFQHRVSTRETSTDNSDGTGLTRLLESLIEKSEKSSNCYVLSGNKIIKFEKDFLKLDSDKSIGFNIENDFVNMIPAEKVIQRSWFNLRGTLYNLNFVIKKEENL